MQRIQERICAAFDISIIDLKSARKTKHLVAPRHIAMLLCKKYTLASFPAIGAAFGERDHSTIMHGCRNAEILIERDASLREKFESLDTEFANDEKSSAITS